MRTMVTLLAALILSADARAQWSPQDSGTDARLRGLCVVNDQVAWASGTGGTVLRTVDGGQTWTRRPVPDAEELDFRDIEAFDDRTALTLSIGEGEQSRIFKTIDGGATWKLKHVNRDPDGFLDALAFWDAEHGLALGDPVGGRFVILTTDDGGETWERIAPEGLPEALADEGAFAASGTCLVVGGDRLAWFGTGGGRVFRSEDRGRTWTAHPTPIATGTASSGIFSLAFRDAEHGVVVGGDYQESDRADQNVALTTDGGRTWQPAPGQSPAGYRSAVVVVPGLPTPTLIAVGPNGSDRSDDGGVSWRPLGVSGFHAVGFASPQAGWAVGEDGRIARAVGLRPE